MDLIYRVAMSSVPPIHELYIQIPEETIATVVSGLTFCSRLSGSATSAVVGGVVGIAVRLVQRDTNGNVVSDVVYTANSELNRYVNYKLSHSVAGDLSVYLVAKALGVDTVMPQSLSPVLHSETGTTDFVEVARTVVYKLQSSTVPAGTNVITLSPVSQAQTPGVAEVDVEIVLMLAVFGLSSITTRTA